MENNTTQKQKIKIFYSNPFRWIYTLFNIATAMIGYNIHGNIFYSIMDFIFAPIAWMWWLIGQDINITIIRDTFSFFFN